MVTLQISVTNQEKPMSKSKIKRPSKPNKAPKNATFDGPNSQEKALMNKLLSEERLTELETLFKNWTIRFPNYVLAWQALGALFKQLDRSPEIQLPIQKKIAELLPENPDAHLNLGHTLRLLGQLDEAIKSNQLALKIKPDFAEAHCNLGITLNDLNRLSEAETSCRQAISLNPDFAEAYNNLSIILYAQGRLDEAEASCRKALEIKPNFTPTHHSLANILYGLRRLDEAEASYLRALESKQDDADLYSNFSLTIHDLGRLDEAEATCLKALKLKPDSAEAYSNLGHILKNLFRLDEAEASYRHALEIKPNFETAFNGLLFTLNYHPDKTGEEIFAAYQEYDAVFGLPHHSEWHPHNNSRETHRRLKVGYVSPDFKKHPMQHFLEPLLAHHDKQAIEVYAYADLVFEDSVTARYKNYIDKWTPVHGMSNAALAELIRADGIDILVELAGHTADNRLGVFARKPAPVSLSWLGYGYSTGLTSIDYFLADNIILPPGCEKFFSEKPWRIENPPYAYRPAEGMGEVNALPALSVGHVVFGVLSRGVRINHRVIRVWSEILKRVKGARLIIDSNDFRSEHAQKILADKFAAHGISRDRLQLGYHSPPWDVLRSLDIGLDCFPHNSGTTLFESLYMGIPFITLAERPSVGRIGSSILEGAEHPEWIAETEEMYIEKAVSLAGDLPKLAVLRSALRKEMESRALMNESAFARKIEDAYRAMFKIWAEGMNQKMDTETPTAEQPLTNSMETKTQNQHFLKESTHDAPTDIKKNAKANKLSKKATQHKDKKPKPKDIQKLITLLTTGQYPNAITFAQSMTARFPLHDFGWKVLGTTYQLMERSDDALVPLKNAVALSPGDAEAHNNLGFTLYNLGRLAEAEASCKQALKIKPNFAEAHCNLGLILYALGQLDEAENNCRRALKIQPDLAEAHACLGNIFVQIPLQLDEAETNYRKAVKIKPSFRKAFSNLLFTLNYHPDKSAEDIFEDYRKYDTQFGLPFQLEWQPHNNRHDNQRRLKVGYVSRDFKIHSTRHFLEPLLAHHDKQAFEIYAYADLSQEDFVTARYKNYVDHWIPTQNLSDAALAEQIRADGIDILLELAGHTSNNRLGVFARKPAPVSASWLGYGYSTGLTAIDYYLTDEASAHPNNDKLFSESIWCLENPPCVYRPAEGMDEVNALPALKHSYITFGTISRAIRINHRTLRVWAEILKRVPRSRLVIDSSDFQYQNSQNLLAENFAALGIDPEQLEIGYHTPPWDILRSIDIGLDCFPHNSGTTLFESLYMGLPFVSLAGRPGVGRLGKSILEGIGHPEWVADNEDEYIEIAVELASDIGRLAQLRAGMRNEMCSSALMDEPAFAKKMEDAFRQMWAIHCTKEV